VPKDREDLFTAVELYSQLSVFIPVLLTGILYQVQPSIQENVFTSDTLRVL